MKTITRLALLSMALITLQAQGSSPVPPQINGISLSHYVTPWQMVSDVFVHQPTKKTHLNWKRRVGLGFATAGLAVTGGFLMGMVQRGIACMDATKYRDESLGRMIIGFCRQATEYPETQDFVHENWATSKTNVDFGFMNVNVGTAIGALAGGILGFLGVRKALRPITLKDAQIWQLEHVLQIWKDARIYFPAELREAIDELKHLKDKKAPQYTAVRAEVLSFVLGKLDEQNARFKNQRFVFPKIKAGYTYKPADHKILGVGPANAELIDEDDKD